jgi:hypothetical protein
MELHHRTASDPDLNMKQLFRSDALSPTNADVSPAIRSAKADPATR